jgi:hypothetical protein
MGQKDRCFDVHHAAPGQLEGKGVPNSEGQLERAPNVSNRFSGKFPLVFAAAKSTARVPAPWDGDFPVPVPVSVSVPVPVLVPGRQAT